MAMADEYLAAQKASGPSMADQYLATQKQDRGLIDTVGQSLVDTKDILKYNANKLGAGINAGLANINETIGLDSSTFRDNQQYYQGNAKEANQALQGTYGDSPIVGAFAREAGNPINYIPGAGLKTLAGIVAGDTANEIATTGDRSGINLDDINKVANNTSVGLGIGKGLDLVSKVNPTGMKRALLGDDYRSQQEIAQLKALAEKHGVTLTPASLTGSGALSKVEHSIDDSLAGGLGMSSALKSEKAGIDNAITSNLERMGANGSNTVSGETARQAMRSAIESEQATFKRDFGQLFASYGDKPLFGITNVKRAAKNLVEEAERIPMLKNTTAVRDAKSIVQTDKMLSWDDWSKFRSHLGALANDLTTTGKANTGKYKQLYSNMADDLAASVDRLGDNAMKVRYNEVLDDYKGYKNLYDSKSGGSQFLRSVSNDKIKSEAIGHMANNSTLKAKALLEGAGVDVKSGVPFAKKASATDTLLASRTGENISLPKFTKYSDREGFKQLANEPNRKPRAIDELVNIDDVVPTRTTTPIPGEGIFPTKDLQDISRAIMQKDSYKNMSKTAQFNMLNAMKAMNPVQLATFLAKDVGISAAYRSKMFRSWLEKGIISKSKYQQLQNIAEPRKSAVRNVATQSLLGIQDEQTNKQKLGL